MSWQDSKKMNAKKSKKKKNAFRYIPVMLAAIVLALGIFAFVSEPSFIGFFNTRYSFDDAVKAVEKIDAKYNVSFSDYSKGLMYLYSHPPKDPLNAWKIDLVLKDYSKISGDEPANLFVNFRENLLEADKYYKLSRKTYKSDIHYAVVCKNRQYFMESLENKENSLQRINTSLSSLISLKQNYPENFAVLNISEDWINLYSDIQEDFTAEIKYDAETFNSFCSNQTINITV
jgi:hypothetical protein